MGSLSEAAITVCVSTFICTCTVFSVDNLNGPQAVHLLYVGLCTWAFTLYLYLYIGTSIACECARLGVHPVRVHVQCSAWQLERCA